MGTVTAIHHNGFTPFYNPKNRRFASIVARKTKEGWLDHVLHYGEYNGECGQEPSERWITHLKKEDADWLAKEWTGLRDGMSFWSAGLSESWLKYEAGKRGGRWEP